MNILRKFRIYRKRSLRFDFQAATVVFLIAIPLCLSIAIASGVPTFAGLLAGIIGGIIVGSLSASNVNVSGPDASMAALVVAAISQLGDFNTFLLALVIAGLIQVIIGALKAGFLADYIPSNVLQGLLCAVGILLIVKQLPLAFTLANSRHILKAELLELSASLSLEPLHELSSHINSGAVILSLLSLAIMIFLNNTTIKWLKNIPAAFVVVIFGILLNEFFILTKSTLAQNGQHLVKIPSHNTWLDFYTHLQLPNWQALTKPNVYLAACMIAIVSSLENLLNIKAGEKIDKKHRYYYKDRELVAQGVGNFFSGLIGGIPINTVIVRTSVNIQAGAKTKFATIMHGTFILLTIILIPDALNKIPLSILAAILIYTGYELTHPAIYKKIYRQGMDRFVPFVATIISILCLNLLTGILIGLMVSLFFILKSNSQVRLDIIKEIYPNGIANRLILPQQTTFLNKASLTAELNTIAPKSQLIIDARHADYIDKEIIELIKEFRTEQAPNKQIALNLIGFKDNYAIHNYIDFINVTTYDVQSTLTPKETLILLQEGNHRFINDTCIHRTLQNEIKYTAQTQYPMATVVGCMDSRVPVETIFDMTVGDLFCIRIAGNVISHDVLASLEYACSVVGSKLIVILGHTHCGAICAACDGVQIGNITQLLAKINPAIAAETVTKKFRTSKNQHFVANVTNLNIANTMQNIYSSSEILKKLIDDACIGIVGAIYDVSTGKVTFKNYTPEISQLTYPYETLLCDKLSWVD